VAADLDAVAEVLLAEHLRERPLLLVLDLDRRHLELVLAALAVGGGAGRDLHQGALASDLLVVRELELDPEGDPGAARALRGALLGAGDPDLGLEVDRFERRLLVVGLEEAHRFLDARLAHVALLRLSARELETRPGARRGPRKVHLAVEPDVALDLELRVLAEVRVPRDLAGAAQLDL